MSILACDALALPDALERHDRPPPAESPAAVYLAALAPGSRPAIRGALTAIARLLAGESADPLTLPWGRVRYQHSMAIRAQLAERYAATTANKMLAALRGVLKAAWRLGQMTAEEYATAADVPPVRGSGEPAGRALARGEVASLLKACAADEGARGRRDAALIAVGYAAGLRRAELVALDVDDYDRAEGAVTVRRGKGNKSRRVYLSPDADQLLQRWLKERGGWAGPVFVGISKSGRVLRRRLRSQAVAHVLEARAGQAGVASCSPHDLRRTMISTLLEAGEDLSTVQKIAGHANVQTTARYDRRGDAAKRRAARRLQLDD